MHHQKIAPCFFIGLGGCGGEIVNEIARKVKANPEEFRRYERLLHFFVLDTDQDDVARCSYVDANHRFVLSDFDKPGYVEVKQGKLHRTPDELFLRWWPEYYRPRSTRGKGAGQIRIESRLAFSYQLENDHAKFEQTLRAAIARAFDVQNPYLANKAARVYVFASLAGGTGSGGSLLVAAWVHKHLKSRGHQVIGTFVLPNVFKNKGLPPNQFDKVMANGYAALSELEWAQSAHDRDPSGTIEFHHDPNDEHATHLTAPPFDRIYLVDAETAAGLVIGDPKLIYPAIADAAHTQIFSTILDKEGSTLDNDTRELMALESATGFTRSFAAFGVSALVLPDRDILEYFAIRQSGEVLRSAFLLGAEAVSEDVADAERIHRAFVEELEARAKLPAEAGEQARTAVEWAGDASKGAIATYLRALDEIRDAIARDARLPGFSEEDLYALEGQQGVADELNRKWKAIKTKLTEAHETAARSVERALKGARGQGTPESLAGAVAGQDPLKERYFLIRLRDQVRERLKQESEVHEKVRDYTPDQQDSQFGEHRDRLAEKAPRSVRDLVGSDYKPVVAEFKPWADRVVKQCSEQVRSRALAKLFQELVKELDQRIGRASELFARAGEIIGELDRRAAKLLAEGGVRAQGGAANEYALDAEVYQNHRSGQRYWDHLYSVMRPSQLAAAGVLQEISRAAAAARTVEEVRAAVIQRLLDTARAGFSEQVVGIPGREDKPGLRMDDGLLFEARTAVAIERCKAPGKVPSIEEVATARERISDGDRDVEAYLGDKLDFAARKCKPFWTLTPLGADAVPVKAYATLAGLYRQQLERRVTRCPSHAVAPGDVIETNDLKRIIFYEAQIGVAIHSVRSVAEYKRRYHVVLEGELGQGKTWPQGSSNKVPDIPLQMDRRWERIPGELGLFDVDMESQKTDRSKKAWASRRASAQGQADAERSTRKELVDFLLGTLFGQIIEKGGELVVVDPARERPLHRFRDRAFERYRSMDPEVKGWVAKEAAAALLRLLDDRRHEEVRQRLNGHKERLELLRRGTEHADEKEFFSRELEAVAQLAAEKQLRL